MTVKRRLPDDTRRSQVLQIRLSRRDRKVLERKARAAGQTMAAYLRDRGLADKVS